MANTPKDVAWTRQIGAGAVSALAGVAGAVLWLAAARSHTLVLRNDEAPSLLSMPALAVSAGVLAAWATLWLRRRLASRHGTEEGGVSLRPGGAPLGVVAGIVAGIMLAAIGGCLWLNCNFGGPERTHVTSVTGMHVWTGVGSSRSTGRSHILRVADWRDSGAGGGGGRVSLYVSGKFYETRQEGDRITVTTREGLLGYECIVRVE